MSPVQVPKPTKVSKGCAWSARSRLTANANPAPATAFVTKGAPKKLWEHQRNLRTASMAKDTFEQPEYDCITQQHFVDVASAQDHN